MTEVYRYDLQDYPFPDLLRDILCVRDLDRMYGEVDAGVDWSIYKTMEASPHYERLRAALLGEDGRDFRALYHRFIAERIRPDFAEPILYQACPTIRLLFADAGGEPRFHRDSDYGHDPAEMNYTVPLTEMFASNAIWIESETGKGDFAPIELKPGEFARFDGASLRHGAIANTTGRSRVSFDFRIVCEDRHTAQRIAEPGVPVELDAHIFEKSP